MHAIWIELPALDIERARTFYSTVFGHEVTEVVVDGSRTITIIPGEPSVSLNVTDGFTPTGTGPIPYFHLDDPMDAVLDRVTGAGGRVLQDAAARADLGLFALVADSEGNVVYVHTGA